MFTRCPSCNSTFRVTAALLQMAEGEVRCGSCGVVFNALHTLVDDWSGTDLPLAGGPPHPPPAVNTPAAPVREGTPVPVDETLEFNAPEQDWQRFFITAEEPAPREARPEPQLGEDFEALDGAAASGAPDTAVPAGEAPAEQAESGGTLEEETADTDTWQGFLREVDTGSEADDEPPYVIGDDGMAAPEEAITVHRESWAATSAPPIFELAPEDEALEPLAPGALSVDDPGHAGASAGDELLADEEPVAARQARTPAARPESILEWDPPPSFPGRPPQPPGHTLRWLTASAAAAVVLAGQALHYFRDQLAADPRYGAVVRDVYDRFDQPLYPDWSLDAYEIRGAKAIAENSAPGGLDIIAEIAVTGSQSVGLPMVRVVLRDRWANAVASGVFDSAQYLAETPSASRAYSPGTLIPVEISLKDPGSTAQGYELDVCVPNRHFGLQCKTAGDPFRR